MSCEVCGKTEQLKTCAKCLRANYCCREHQIAHWQIHKQWCAALAADNNNTANMPTPSATLNVNNDNNNDNNSLQNNNQASLLSTMMMQADDQLSQLDIGGYYNTNNNDNSDQNSQQQQMNYMVGGDLSQQNMNIPFQNILEQQNSPQQQQQENIGNYSSIPETVSQFNQNYQSDGSFPMQNAVYENVLNDPMPMMGAGAPNGTSTQSTIHSTIVSPSSSSSSSLNSQSQLSPSSLMSAQFNSQRDFILQNLNRYCQMILNDMNQYGFCVIDDFLQNGDQILSEVLTLYQNGRFRNGQVVNSKGTPDAKLIRGDQIVWVEYSEPSCNNVGFLIRILDSIVTRCNATLSGEFAKYNISRRTKAMIACYPGNFSKYVRHIDNPNNDGRCITSIYYLNKDYNRQKDGGVLRLFPQMNNSIVADVEPKFNRVIFFWSDRRNPHEVMPSARMRFAITVWYFDEAERAKAVEKLKQKYPQYPNDKVLVPF